MEYDYAVVGGGPAGCLAACEAASHGDAILFEEHHVQPVHCAGLISSSGLRELGIGMGDFVLNRVRGARLYSPLGTVVEIKTSEVKAVAVDRSLFDRHLLERALSEGVSYENKTVDRVSGGVITAGKKKFTVGKTILATGTNYNLQKKMRINHPSEFLLGAQYEMDIECDRDRVELHFIIPDFFAWVIPLDGRARVGLCTKSNPTPHLHAFIKKLEREKRLRSRRILGRSYGVIPLYNPHLRTQYKEVNLVGDAAGQVKATTGGGVVMGGIAAKYAWSDGYERLWKKAVGVELALHLGLYRFTSRLSPKNVDRLFKMTSESKSCLEEYGHMDYASRTLKGLVRNPAFALKFLLNTPSFLLDLL